MIMRFSAMRAGVELIAVSFRAGREDQRCGMQRPGVRAVDGEPVPLSGVGDDHDRPACGLRLVPVWHAASGAWQGSA